MKKEVIKEKSTKALRVATSEDVTNYVSNYTNGEFFAEFLNTTKNGTLKLSKSKPENNEDEHGTIKVGLITYYLVSAGSSKSSTFSSLKSFIDYKDYLKRLAERAENMKTFDEFCKSSANEWNKLSIIGITISDEQKHTLYEQYKAKFFAAEPVGNEDEE